MFIRRVSFLAAVVALVMGTAGEPHAWGDPDDALLAHWTFDQVSDGTVADRSGNGNLGIVHGAGPVSGAVDGALAFDGVDDYVELGDLGGHAATTVAFWMKADAVQPGDDRWKGLVSSDGWEEGVLHIPYGDHVVDIYIHAGGSQRARLESPHLEPGQWYHVAVTADTEDRSTQLFVNGELLATDSLGPLDGPIRLIEQVAGRESGGRYFAGAIDDVRIYSTALNAEQVRALCPDATPIERDPRDITTGLKIPDEGYCDQPYVVKLPDGSWLCTMTTGKGGEGDLGQHVVATISEDQGTSWGPLIDIEPASGPEASWVVPLVVPGGRVYAFYTYNGDNIRTLPDGQPIRRSDTHGWYVYRYSDDGGRTWSKDRYRIPMRVTAADLANQWEGQVQHFWGIDKPKVSDGVVRFAFTKLGRYFLRDGEGWMMHSDNILTEPDPEKINWTLLPDGEHGIRLEKFGSVQEEHNHVPIGDDRLYVVYRTTTGYPCHTYSDDGGHTWTKPEHMTYAPGGRKIKNPRACPKLFKCENGKYLFWFHFNGTKTFGRVYDEWSNRNPVWVTGGVVRDGKMHWSEPEILLYHNAPKQRGMSYPDLIEQDGKYWITETQKEIVRVHEIDPALLEGLWGQHEGKEQVAKDGLALSIMKPVTQATEAKMPRLPDLASGSGFTIDLWLQANDLKEGQVILDSRNDQSRGVALEVVENGAVRLHFSDGANKAGAWTSDPSLLKEGQRHHIIAIVDGGPNIITFVVDGKLCDGGASRQFGWSRFDKKIADVNGSDRLRLSPSFLGKVFKLRVYDRMLRTSEAVANHHADSR